MKNSNKAITLIALVITIIVLLILAGVTILTLAGENGLLNRAKLAKETSQNASIEENIALLNYENKIDESVSGIREQVAGNTCVELTSTFSSNTATFTYPEGYNMENTYIMSSKAYRPSNNAWYQRYTYASATTNNESIICYTDRIVWNNKIPSVTFTNAKILIMKIEN